MNEASGGNDQTQPNYVDYEYAVENYENYNNGYSEYGASQWTGSEAVYYTDTYNPYSQQQYGGGYVDYSSGYMDPQNQYYSHGAPMYGHSGQNAPIYRQDPPQQYYYNHNQQQQWNNKPRRGGRGRGNKMTDSYYGGGRHTEYQPQTAAVNGARPKQFSYQGNRYRDNRKRNTNNTDMTNGHHDNTDNNTHRSYSLMKNQKKEEKLQNTGDEVEVEDYFTAPVDVRDDDEYTYTEKTARGRGYTQRGGGRGTPRVSGGSRGPRGRGGYSSQRRTGSVQYSQEISRADHYPSGGKDGTKRDMTVLGGKKDRGKDGEDENKENKPKDKSKSEKSDVKSRGRGHKKFQFKGDQDDETQRGLLIEQLSSNSYECMVCCEIVRRDAAVWGCNNCYHIYHLRCIKKWARSPTAAVEGQSGWRCPACQNVTPLVPNQYRCFCGKVRDPENTRYDTPHSCGEVCGRKRLKLNGCPHPCVILCHPGPCPTCQSMVSKSCNCGRFKMTVKCGQAPAIKCQEKCGKTLNCGRHECEEVCHSGSCKPCMQTQTQSCYCGKESRTVVCGSSESFVSSYCCEQPCGRQLSCGEHACASVCHAGTCAVCALSPDALTHCPCGRTPLSDLLSQPRERCTDPIPTCEHVCDKSLDCGPQDSPHHCCSPCHSGPCPACDDTTQIYCRCRALSKHVPCTDVQQYREDSSQYVCDKRCNKKRDCGRHRCPNTCCVDTEHKCDQICGHKLSCGLHRCEELCHRGNCHKCWNVSFDELRCHCGSEVIYPPIACGTRPPECDRTCTRMHSCGHDVLHNCHSESRCPPCTALTEKWCLGKHELRRNIPCHLTEISCGMKCHKPLPCGQHKCQQTCHKGECVSGKERCTQPCTRLREACGHACASACHSGRECPDTPCKAEVTLKCACGSRSEKAVCQVTLDNDYQRMAASLALRMSDTRDGQSVDISNITATGTEGHTRRLECNQDCAIKERNRRLALALEIKNPDLSSKLGNPSYTDFLKDYAKKYTSFVSGIEKTLVDLIQTAQKSVQKSRSHAFPPMTRDQRRLIHELAEFYGCQTQSYDQEPKKNVVVSAYKDKCYKPSVSLTSCIQRELHPKAPVPIPHRSTEDQVRSSVQAAKQSTKVLDSASRSSSWTSKTSKPLNAWTTLKSSKSSSNQSGSSKDSSQSAAGGRMIDTPSPPPQAVGLRPSESDTALPRAPWNVKPLRHTNTEPLIDYFEMTD